MSNLAVLTDRQKTELHKAIVQYLEAYLSNASDPIPNSNDVLETVKQSLKVNTTALADTIPNYLEKKWSTVLRLQKKVMDLEGELDNMRKALEARAINNYQIGNDKIYWLPNSYKHLLRTQGQQVNTVAIHPFLPVVICGCMDGTIVVWNLAVDDKSPEKIIKAHTRSVNKLCWSRVPVDLSGSVDANLDYVFASCSSDLSIKIWQGSKYDQIRTLNGHEHTVSSVSFSTLEPAVLYSVSRDKTVKAWDLVNASCVKTFIGHSDWVRDIDLISLNCKIVPKEQKRTLHGDFVLTASNDQSVRLSHAETGTGLALLIGHTHVVESVRFLPLHSNIHIDKFIEQNATKFPSMPIDLVEDAIYNDVLGFKYCVSCGRDNSIKLWMLPPPLLKPHRPPTPSNINNSQGWLIANLIGHTSWVKSLSIHPSGRLLFSCSDDKTIKVWDLESLVSEGSVKCIKTLIGHEAFVNDVVFAPYEIEDNSLPPNIEDPETLLKFIESNMRCILVSGSVDNTVRVWG